MGRFHHFAGIAALALLASCGSETETNVTTTVQTDNGSEIIVPQSNVAAGNDAVSNSVEGVAPVVNIAPDGLSLVGESGSTRHLTFGMTREAVVAAVGTALGTPTGTARNEECGQGPVDTTDFKGGLSLSFQQGKFVGWDLDGRDKPPFTTAAGIGTGSTLRQLRDVMKVTVEESTLGTEFAAGELGGLLSADAPDGKIEHMWAGSVCQFR
ncbi:hypothetical protein P1X14_05085 [Sphingomonas sp. AOB5]|uniref:hypothetical protein n=1 Tax=Sphingomonas sp. AOB5 TaxID=3034017 RepID=UPI0023F97300|nr:hypothetical protein [Sphingomonas sp. AOB5]MDF7774612.1 hypothetical protein [Sphingomonas sp. AOB5]